MSPVKLPARLRVGRRAPLGRAALGARIAAALATAAALLVGVAMPTAARAQTGDEAVQQARDALRLRDRARLASLRAGALAARHPLALWVDYWELNNRLAEAQTAEVEAFYARWPGSYVEDRLRNDWLLELGRRRDWDAFVRDVPRFRMNDDREVTCYRLLTQQLAGQDVRSEARSAWLAQRDADDGCLLMARTLFDAGQLNADDAWAVARQAAETNRPRVARAAALLVSPAAGDAVGELFDDPARFLAALAAGRRTAANDELVLLALMRLAAADADAAAAQLSGGNWRRRLAPAQLALAWAAAARQSALKLQPDALSHYRKAWAALGAGAVPTWSDDMLAWQVRAALRAPAGEPDRWALVKSGIDAMTPLEQRDAAWVYWKSRAMRALAPAGDAGEPERIVARVLLESIASQTGFYGKLATEDLGGRIALPPAPLPPTRDEREAARRTPGFARALQLIGLGLRSEGVREWNFTLRGLGDGSAGGSGIAGNGSGNAGGGDRELLAAAALACEREVWDRCINTSERTRNQVDVSQRYPTPFRRDVLAVSQQVGLEPAFVYGLIRQESRFVMDARSGVGASGLMQIMPATAKWTAKKIGVDYRPEMIADRATNLRLGAAYLKLVLDDLGGSQALAAAAYNAGPNRPRRWREGAVVEPAAWIENIPFNETRDYVKKVLANAVDYSALLTGQVPSLKARLGTAIGPRDAAAPSSDRDLP